MRRSGRLADKGHPTGSAPSAEPSASTSTADKSHPQTHIGSTTSSPRSTPSAEPSTSSSPVEVARAKLESLEKDSISFRLLEALLKHAPTVEGANVIITDIIAASAEPNGLDQLAEFYKTGRLLIPSKLLVIISSCPHRSQ